jgi:elongation factor Tu
LSKVDLASEAGKLDVVERDVRQALADADYPADDLPVVRGDIDELVEAMEVTIPTPQLPWRERRLRDPLLMWFRSVTPGEGGVFVWGKVERGVVKAGDLIEVVGQTSSVVPIDEVNVNGVERPARAGDDVSLRLVGLDALPSGRLIGTPDSAPPGTEFDAVIYLSSGEPGVPNLAIRGGVETQVCMHGSYLPARMSLPSMGSECTPGGVASVAVRLPPVPISAPYGGMTFQFEDRSRRGVGRVTRVLG